MNDLNAGSVLADAQAESPASAQPPDRLPLWVWMREGLRVALFLPPRTATASPTPVQLLVLVLFHSTLSLTAAWIQATGPVRFNLHGWLAPMWSPLLMLWVAWWAMAPARSPGIPTPSGRLAAWYVLWVWASILPSMLYSLVWLALRWHGGVGSIAYWVVYGVATVWGLWALARMSARFIRSFARTLTLFVVLGAVIGMRLWQLSNLSWYSPWLPDHRAVAEASAQSGDAKENSAWMALSQSVFEEQQALWQRQIDALPAQRPDLVDVYGLVFSPYAEENVFRRESSMVSALLQERFDARGRVLHLLNHAKTAATHVWATPENLERAIAALGQRMDREQDLLVVYLTSHGALDHELTAALDPLEVASVTPAMLRAALDAAGIRNRVIAVSACYSGGWIEPLATDYSLIMTASDATHTSYGCGSGSKLTYFGRAVFDEQLRQTHSFTKAFANAVPLIAQREREAGKDDGFSNPQIHVGAQIAPVLQALEQRLDAAPVRSASDAKP
ncbi:hypothetical protein D5038_01730 [Verminephrobacter aporrectodeae subsp. tuberculatae]|uniref:C13 family peptidase n=1 Tax=Verminephrobacter aporrectodeae TaxID=1110389 RepID=UPI0022370124|nr:C13 family peptidase [Verminephrobacter aporrectodeae]MCW5255129.1 hypothetical protein [Verminephrobacter aporrectodeae subsp. tuberculatae]